jgi:uncharacterized protein YlzI (FlbEa/FlbD family)
MGRYQRRRTPSYGNGAHVIAVKKLDGSMMHLNEDLIERVEEGADGQSAVYLLHGGHIIAANDPATVVEMIRAEKASLLRRALHGPDGPPVAAIGGAPISSVTRLSQVRGQ